MGRLEDIEAWINASPKVTAVMLDHPCRETCSGWKQGYDRGYSYLFDDLRDLMVVVRAAKALKERLFPEYMFLLKELPLPKNQLPIEWESLFAALASLDRPGPDAPPAGQEE